MGQGIFEREEVYPGIFDMRYSFYSNSGFFEIAALIALDISSSVEKSGKAFGKILRVGQDKRLGHFPCPERRRHIVVDPL